MCLALVLMVALAEMAALRQWHQQYALADIQQAGAGTNFPSIRPRPN
jgi:hypothetical protein